MQNIQMHDGETLTNKDSAPAGHMGVFARKNYFSPHWSMGVIEKALEAYCKIGVPTNVLISGIPAQNRAVLLSEARVLGLGPRFMSIYIQKLAIEQCIYYDEVEGLTVEWLVATSTLVLSMSTNRRAFRRGSSNKWRAFEEVALTCPYELKVAMNGSNERDAVNVGDSIADMDKEPSSRLGSSDTRIEPTVFPLTVRLLSTIPVALHAVGGDDGPLDIGVRLYTSSYFR